LLQIQQSIELQPTRRRTGDNKWDGRSGSLVTIDNFEDLVIPIVSQQQFDGSLEAAINFVDEFSLFCPVSLKYGANI
jgi:hypothetical protein